VGKDAGDRVGEFGVALVKGNYVVTSPLWNAEKGAATWCDGEVGCTGMVSAVNSLVGGSAGDQVGDQNSMPLTNGNYVIRSNDWSSGIGAHTWCDGSTGCVGTVSPVNSLVGTTPGDGSVAGTIDLLNGNYVVYGMYWDNGSAENAGAVTWCDGSVGCVGPISAANSFVGNEVGDLVGFLVTSLNNGHYVIVSDGWDFSTATEAGAVTWCNGFTGCTGSPSQSVSLIGGREDDLSVRRHRASGNGHYVVISPYFDRGTARAGAATRPG
jgi:hypothetical protein